MAGRYRPRLRYLNQKGGLGTIGELPKFNEEKYDWRVIQKSPKKPLRLNCRDGLHKVCSDGVRSQVNVDSFHHRQTRRCDTLADGKLSQSGQRRDIQLLHDSIAMGFNRSAAQE